MAVRKAKKTMVKSTLTRQELVNTLAAIRPALAKNDIVPHGICFNFDPHAVFTSDDRMIISHALESGLMGSVQADDLYKLLSRLTADNVALEQTENEVRVTCGKVKAGLRLLAETWTRPNVDDLKWTDISPELSDALQLASFSVGTDFSRPKLTCVHCRGDHVVSSDNIRVTMIELAKKAPKFALPGYAAILTDYVVTSMAQDDNWLHFSNGKGLVFSVQKLEVEDLGDISALFDIKGKAVELPVEKLQELISRTMLMTEGKVKQDLTIEIRLTENKVIGRAEKATGWIEEELTIEYNGPDVVMLINPIFLSEILLYTNRMTVQDGKVLFESAGMKHVLCLKG